MKTVMYDLIYSPDEGGWYAEVYQVTIRGSKIKGIYDLVTTKIHKSHNDAANRVYSFYPQARLSQVFN